MHHIQATLKLYGDAATATATGFVRSLWALAVLLVGAAVLAAAEPLLFEPLGGGTILSVFGRALLQDAFIGTWLSLVGVWVMARRTILFRHLRVHAGNLFMPVLTVVFFFWIAEMVMGYFPIRQDWMLITAIAIVFNPVPEVLYQERDEGLSALQASAEFLWKHLLEWLFAQVPWLLALGAWMLLFHRSTSAPILAQLWRDSGPLLQPLHTAAMHLGAATSGQLFDVLGGVLLLAGVHAWFLFRGHLFHSLSKGNRRLRAWQARM